MGSWRIFVWGVAAVVLAACGAEGGGAGAAGAAAEEQVEAEPFDAAAAASLPAGATLEMAEEGRRLFPVCAVCHGFDAAGTQLGPPLRDAEWISISGELPEIEAVIRDGVPEPEEFPVPMPALGGGDFTPEQVRALAAYVYALSHSGR